MALLGVATSTPAAATASWSLSSSPNSGTSDNYLNGVSCLSASSCKAVGYFYNGGTPQTLIESWNGTMWTVDSSPNSGSSQNILTAVSCASATSCEAVGSYVNTTLSEGQTLIESWNGTTWSVVPSPNVGTRSDELDGVSCVSATSCQAVGQYTLSTGFDHTLIESWNGSKWSVVPSPNKGTNENRLLAISCVSAKACKAVGHYIGSVNQTLIESWNGTKWSIVPSPNNGTSYNDLTGVSCVSVKSCEAVGFYTGTSLIQTLIESWNGTKWSIVPSPNNGPGNNDFLSAVSCASARSCQAVGYYRNSSSINQTLIEALNGTTWSLVSSPDNGTDNNALNSVRCVSSSSCKAVGSYFSDIVSRHQTLIESYG
jgi:hypothetical protein